MVFLTNLLYYKRHITESDNGYVPYCFLQCCFSQSTSKICTLFRFTLFSNLMTHLLQVRYVLLPHRFTLFSNAGGGKTDYLVVLLPYRFTLFSNGVRSLSDCCVVLLPYRFTLFSNPSYLFQLSHTVLLPYRFTLFSNRSILTIAKVKVLLPYRFTLFSNLNLKIKCTHYTVHGKSIRIFYNICIMIVNKIHTNHYQSQQGVPCCNPALMFS